jgi:aryl-alcohol dehydrogenase-like predicted oxidoreductase
MIEELQFGRTGHLSTRVLFGAAALGKMSQDEADDVLETLLEYGVNHIDTARSYGQAELRIAPWLVRHPDRFFLATKTGERTGPAARASLEESLERLGVDHVDLIQLHNLVEEDEWEVAHGPGGAVEALVKARDEGLVRFIGVTGHGLRIPQMHLRSLERFDFDSVLMPYNFVLASQEQYRQDVEAVFELCAERQVAVQTIKSMARRRWDERRPEHRSWYEPIVVEDEGPEDNPGPIERAVRWVLGRPGIFLNSSSDTRLLRSILETASNVDRRPTDTEMQADVDALGIRPLFDGSELERI